MTPPIFRSTNQKVGGSNPFWHTKCHSVREAYGMAFFMSWRIRSPGGSCKRKPKAQRALSLLAHQKKAFNPMVKGFFFFEILRFATQLRYIMRKAGSKKRN